VKVNVIKKSIFIMLSVIAGILAVSATVEFGRMMSGFSIRNREELSFAAGFAAYILVHFLLYKPVFMHVMAHELTHALWALPFGGRADDMTISTKGGRVKVSKTNFLISLAPYFFPLYAMAFALIYFIARDEYRVFIAFFMGAALSFHIALTLFSLRSSQSDFHADSDFVFSIIFVYLMNIIMISLVLTVLFKDINFITFMKNMFVNSAGLVAGVFKAANEAMK